MVAGIFSWYVWLQTEDNEGVIWEKEDVDGYVVEGRKITNPKYGLAMMAPEGWIIKNYDDQINIFSPNTEFNENGEYMMSKMREQGGCGIALKIEKYKKIQGLDTHADYLRILIEEAKTGKFNTEEIKEEVINIAGHESLKTTYFKKGEEISIEIKTPIGNIVYDFTTGVIYSNHCIDYFQDAINTVQISG